MTPVTCPNVWKDIADSVVFFQRLFQLTVALALGESFKQFVADESKSPAGNDHVYFDRIPALLTFIAIIVPFFDGMNRYFYYNYIKECVTLPTDYARHILIDSSFFLAESALFFIMSRALRLERVGSYAAYISFLMVIDVFWTAFSLLPSRTKFVFISLDTALLMLMVLSFVIIKDREKLKCLTVHEINRIRLILSCFMCGVNLVVLVIGYYISWEFYFPKI